MTTCWAVLHCVAVFVLEVFVLEGISIGAGVSRDPFAVCRGVQAEMNAPPIGCCGLFVVVYTLAGEQKRSPETTKAISSGSRVWPSRRRPL